MKVGILLLAMGLPGLVDEPRSEPGAQDRAHRFLAEGRSGLVIGLTGPRAVPAGVEALKRGGSAVDAALTTALVQVVEAAGSYVSFAGILNLVYYDASTGKVSSLNAGYNTPLEEKDPLSIPRMDEKTWKGLPSGRTVLVPGFMAGVQAAHDRFGKRHFPDLFQPAIELAEEGVKIDPLLAYYLQFRKDVLGRLPETQRLFARPDGSFHVQGDLLRQRELASTLRKVASGGSAYMYTGEWARQFVAAVGKEGGRITAQDLATYQPGWEQATETTYRAVRVFAPGLSSIGGVDTIEALNLLELSGLSRSGLPSRSPESLFWLMQISHNQFLFYEPELAARRFPAEDFSPRIRVSKEHARWLWTRMQVGEWPFAVPPNRLGSRPAHSSGVVAIDSRGNIAALTHTCNAVIWGNTGIFVGGVSVPDSASFQQEVIQRTGPGKRLPDPETPLIITLGGHPILAASAIGAGLHQRNLQILANILEFGMDAQSAVDAPAFLAPDWSQEKSVARVGDGSFDKRVLEGVRQLGQRVEIVSRPEDLAFAGFWIGVELDPKTGELHAAGARQTLAYAEGY